MLQVTTELSCLGRCILKPLSRAHDLVGRNVTLDLYLSSAVIVFI